MTFSTSNLMFCSAYSKTVSRIVVLSSASEITTCYRAATLSGETGKHGGQIRNICSSVIVNFTPRPMLHFNQETKCSHQI